MKLKPSTLFIILLITMLQNIIAISLPFDGKYINKSGLFSSEIGLSSRNIALGRAFVAVADDYTSVYFNPAGIGFKNSAEFGISYTYLIEDARFASGTLDFPLNDLFAFAISYSSRFFSTPFQGINEFGIETHTFGYYEGSALLGSSFKIFENSKLGKVNIGISIKLANLKMDDIGEFGFGLDSGILWDISSIKSKFGVSMQNIVAPNMNINGTDNKYPRILKIGLSTTLLNNFLFSLEGDIVDFTSGDSKSFNLLGGVEWIPVKYITLQAGGNINEISIGITGKLNGFNIGYAFTLMPNKDFENISKHFISISYKLGYTPDEHEKELAKQSANLEYAKFEFEYNKLIANEEFTKAAIQLRNMIDNRNTSLGRVDNKLKIELNEIELKIKAEQLYLEAKKEYEKENYSNAFAKIQEVYKINPNYKQGSILKEKIYNHQTVIDKLSKATELFKNSKFEQSYSLIEDCIKLEPKNKSVLKLQAQLKPHVNEKLALDITEQARIFFKVGDTDKALSMINEALELYNQCFPATELKAKVINAQAQEFYNKAFAKFKDEKYDESLSYLENLNKIKNSGKDFIEIKDQANKLFKLASGKKFLLLANSAIEKEDYKNAEINIKKAISFDPDNSEIKETYQRIKQMKEIMGQ